MDIPLDAGFDDVDADGNQSIFLLVVVAVLTEVERVCVVGLGCVEGCPFLLDCSQIL